MLVEDTKGTLSVEVVCLEDLCVRVEILGIGGVNSVLKEPYMLRFYVFFGSAELVAYLRFVEKSCGQIGSQIIQVTK